MSLPDLDSLELTELCTETARTLYALDDAARGEVLAGLAYRQYRRWNASVPPEHRPGIPLFVENFIARVAAELDDLDAGAYRPVN